MAPRLQILLTIAAFNLAASVVGAAVGVSAEERDRLLAQVEPRFKAIYETNEFALLPVALPPALADLALEPAHVVVAPWKQHIPPTKRQGVAGIERTAKGRLWAIYGRDVESTRNFQVLKCSDDDGKKWSDAKLMILPRAGTRAMSANVWIDPQGRLWVFWGRARICRMGASACGPS